LEVVKESTSCL